MKALIVLSMLYLVAGDDKMVQPPPLTKTVNTTLPQDKPTTKSTEIPITTLNTTTSSTTTTTTPKTTTTPPTPPPNTTTTSIPTTTTSIPTTPTPQPPLTPGKWVVNNTNTNKTCLVFEAALQIDLVITNKTYTINVPSTSQAEGICGNKTENITIKFGEANSVTFDFLESNDSKKYDLEMIIVTLRIPEINGSNYVLTNQTKEFSTPVSNSYKCAPERSLDLVAVDKAMTYKGRLRVSYLQMQAFMNSTNQKFDEAVDCEGSETPDVVPIAVGLALVTLVIIVLVAYLIGRRRSQARGYLSMFPENKREEDYIPMKNLSCFN